VPNYKRDLRKEVSFFVASERSLLSDLSGKGIF